MDTSAYFKILMTEKEEEKEEEEKMEECEGSGEVRGKMRRGGEEGLDKREIKDEKEVEKLEEFEGSWKRGRKGGGEAEEEG